MPSVLAERTRHTFHSVSDDFSSWLDSMLHNGKYDYLVVNARRAWNLLWSIRPDCFDTSPKLVSDVGWLSVADQYAAILAQNNRPLPKALIIDDIIVHGRAINSLLDKFVFFTYDILSSSYGKHLDCSEVRDAILEATTISVYIQNKMPLLISTDYQQRIRPFHVMSTGEWHPISCTLRDLLSGKNIGEGVDQPHYSPVANTSYIVSAYHDASSLSFCEEVVSTMWVKTDAMFRGSKLTLYRFEPEKSFTNTYATVRQYQVGDCVYFTPYLLHGRLPLTAYRAVAQALSEKLRATAETPEIVKQLQRFSDCQDCTERSAQLVEMVLGHAVLNLFVKSAFPQPDCLCYDNEKITCNFVCEGKQSFNQDLMQLQHVSWEPEDLQKLLSLLTQNQTDYFADEQSSNDSRSDVEFILKRCEDTIFAHSLNSEYWALEFSSPAYYESYLRKVDLHENMMGKQKESIFETREISYEDFLQKAISGRWDKDIPPGAPLSRSNLGELLASIFYLMDHGDLSLHVAMSKDDFQTFIGLSFRHTELTPALYSYRLGAGWSVLRVLSEYVNITHKSYCKVFSAYWDKLRQSEDDAVRKYADANGKDICYLALWLATSKRLYPVILNWPGEDNIDVAFTGKQDADLKKKLKAEMIKIIQ